MNRIIFTNYFDAKRIHLSHPEYAYFAISNGIPKNMDTSIFKRLDFFTPEWEEVKKNKDGGSWEDFSKAMFIKMKISALDIARFINDVVADREVNTFVLCCWENTCKGARCHRQIVHDFLKANKKLASMISLEYRHGNEVDIP